MSAIVQLSKGNPKIAHTPASFLSLPSELRNMIYELTLVHQELINPWADRWADHWANPWAQHTGQQKLTPGLLHANKAVHVEAGPLFYGQNHFDFANATPKEVASFLKKIGINNAGYIRHIVIDFPKFLYLDPGDVVLTEDSVSILAAIQCGCPNLHTLTTSLDSTNSMELRLDNLEHHNVATEALKLVDTHFRAISSLQEIILEVYEDGPNDHIRKRMKGHGWTISTTEYVEEEDWGRDFSDFDDYDYGYGEGDDDDYDIDNDSDFWRRAAD